MSINAVYDVIVVGGGPSGMMAAGTAASRGLRVLLIEKNVVLGKKLSITGGGRCNITNAEYNTRVLLKQYGAAEQFLYAPYAQFSVHDTIQFFESRGVPVKIENRKRAFPLSERAEDVTHAMVQYMETMGVEIRSGVTVHAFVTHNGTIQGVDTSVGVLTAHAYVLATGGKSHTETGSTGEGLSWLSSLGHTVHASNPNLVPLVVSDTWVQHMSGTVLTDVRMTCTQGAERLVIRGDILCTHFGLSGPTILNAAHAVKQLLVQGPVAATIDLFPNDDVGTLRKKLQELFAVHSNKTVANALREWLPKSIVEVVLSVYDEHMSLTKVHSLVREKRHALVDRMKQMPLTVTGTKGYDWAVVSDGGIDLKEIDTKAMRSQIHPNLYLVGDVLHVNRPSGGYSLQLCWTTGYVAGMHV
jgi:hypothetical protein